MSRLKLLLLILIPLLLLAGGGFFYFSTGSSEAKVEGPQTRPPQGPELVPTLAVWGYGDAEEEVYWKETLTALEAELHAVILPRWYSSELEYSHALRNALSIGEGPDLFMTGIDEAEVLYRANLITPLILPEEETIGWVPSTLQAFRRGEEYLALPSSFSVLVLYYNPRLFDRKGLAHPDDHWDWESFLAMARALYSPKDESGNEVIYGMELPLRWDYWNALSGQMGAPLYDEKLAFAGGATGPAARSLMQLTEWVQQYAVCTTYTGVRQKTSFEMGQAAMLVGGAELLGRLREVPDLKWGVTSLPKAKQESTTLQVQAWAVSGRTKFRDRAYQAIQYLAQRAPVASRLPAWKPNTVLLMTPPTSRFYAETAQLSTLPPHPLAPVLLQLIDQRLQDLAGEKGTEVNAILEEINVSIKKHPQWKP